MPRIHELDGGVGQRIGDVVITGVDDDIDLPPELLPIDVESGLADESAKSSSASWGWHASQWLKGGAALIGAAALGSIGYLTRSSWGSTSGSSVEADSFGLVPSQGGEAGLTLHQDITTSDLSLGSRTLLQTSVDAPVELSTTQEIEVEPSLDLEYPSGDSIESPFRRQRRATDEFRVNSYTADSQRFPSVANLTSSSFVVVWDSSEQDSSSFGIYGQRFDSNGGFQGVEFPVNTYTVGDQSFPKVANLVGGGFVVIWSSTAQDVYMQGVYGQLYDIAGAPQGAEFPVNTFVFGAQYMSTVAALNGGGFVVVWASGNDQDGDQFGVYGRRYAASGLPQGGEFLINTYTVANQISPSIAALASGGFIVTWRSDGQDGDGFGVFGQRYDASGIRQGIEFQVNTYTVGDQDAPSVAALTGGGFVVVWRSEAQDGDSFGIFGQRYSSGGAVQGSEFMVNTTTSGFQISPTIAALTGGGFMVVWQQGLDQDGSGFGVYGQHYDASGVPLGREFLVNTYTAGNQQSASVAPLTGNSFVVTWYGEGADDSVGVAARIFADSPVITANHLTIDEGQTLILTPAMLSALDADSYDYEVVFTVSNVQYGQFEQVSLPGVAIDSFTQQQVVFSETQFVHDGGELGPSYDVTVCDGPFSSSSSTATITFSNVNDAPVLSSAPSPILTTIDEDTVAPAGDTVATIIVGGSITDADGAAVEAMAITATDETSGVWEYSTDGISWNPVNSVSDVSSLLLDSAHKLRFIPTAEWSGSATFTFRAWDKSTGAAGTKVSTVANGGSTAFSAATDTATITVTVVNDAPVLSSTATPVLTTIDEDTVAPAGDTVASIIVGGSITDADGAAVEAMAITATDESNGVWEYSIDGSSWNPVNSVSDVSSLLLDSAHKLRFIPTAEWSGSATFTFRAWDKSTGVAGTKVSTVANGGSTAFSAATDTATITVTAVNDAPVLSSTATPILTTIDEDTVAPAGDTVASIIVGGSITDADGAAVEAMAITATDETNGVWEYSIDGSSWNPVNSVSDVSSLLLDSAHKLRFIPTPDWSGSATFTFRAWDKSTGAAGTKVSTVANGGSTAFSAATDTATITVTAVNDAPVLSTTATYTLSDIAEDTLDPAGDSIDSIVTAGSISDPDSSIGAMAITAADDGNGGWQYSFDGSSWRDINPVSDASSLLLDIIHRVRFIPDPDWFGNATFTFRAWDKSMGIEGTYVGTATHGGSTAFSDEVATATVSVIPVNDAPEIVTNTLTIDQGETIIFDYNMLQAIDIDSNTAILEFILHDVTHGQFELVEEEGLAISRFFQQQVNAYAVQFVHDGNGRAPSYRVAVSDGELTTAPTPATITFKAEKNLNIIDESKVVVQNYDNELIIAGASGAAMLVGLLLLFAVVNKKRRKKTLAQAITSMTTSGSPHILTGDALTLVASQLFGKIKISGLSGRVSIASMREYVTAVTVLLESLDRVGINITKLPELTNSQQKIVLRELLLATRSIAIIEPSICCRFFKPEVTPEDITKNAMAIAQEVKVRLQGGDLATAMMTEFSEMQFVSAATQASTADTLTMGCGSARSTATTLYLGTDTIGTDASATTIALGVAFDSERADAATLPIADSLGAAEAATRPVPTIADYGEATTLAFSESLDQGIGSQATLLSVAPR